MLPKKILTWSLIISVVSHLLVLSLTGFLNVQGSTAGKTTFSVDLREPTPAADGHSSPERTTPPPVSVPAAVNPATHASEEETVSLDSTQTPFTPYLKRLRKKIAQVWTYPPEALAREEEGITIIRFTVSSDGSLAGITTLSSSGRPSVDEGAVMAVRSAAPYDPLPLNLTKLNIVATFRCRLGN